MHGNSVTIMVDSTNFPPNGEKKRPDTVDERNRAPVDKELVVSINRGTPKWMVKIMENPI